MHKLYPEILPEIRAAMFQRHVLWTCHVALANQRTQ